MTDNELTRAYALSQRMELLERDHKEQMKGLQREYDNLLFAAREMHKDQLMLDGSLIIGPLALKPQLSNKEVDLDKAREMFNQIGKPELFNKLGKISAANIVKIIGEETCMNKIIADHPAAYDVSVYLNTGDVEKTLTKHQYNQVLKPQQVKGYKLVVDKDDAMKILSEKRKEEQVTA